MIFAITGPDGAGKSTLCRETLLCFEKDFGKGSVSIASIWDTDIVRFFGSREEIRNYLHDLNPYSRALLIFHAVRRSIELAQRQGSEIILVDGYWYKYAVSELGMGAEAAWLISVVEKMPVPDFTLYLEIEPELAASRKTDISLYERGIVAGGDEVSQFISFQRQLVPIWKRIEEHFGPWTHASAQAPHAELSQILLGEYSRRKGIGR